jgi:hypothetical protein
MAYRDFNREKVKQKLEIQEVGIQLFDIQRILKIQPSERLIDRLSDAGYITLSTELAISAQIIAPILADVRKRNDHFQIFSGETIDGNKKLGLNGAIDFVFSEIPITSVPDTPVFLLLKMSKTGILIDDFPQAMAQMLGVRYFNKNRGSDIEIIHSIVTDGTTWRIMKLECNTVFVDQTNFSTENLPLLLGVLQEIVNFYKK